MSLLTNKIDADDRTVEQVLKDTAYEIDYFQREYRWGESHIEQLITDLTSAFLHEYTDGDTREQGKNYNNYYLGPLVFIERDSGRSIIDGQQRLTSLILFLIYLNHLQQEFGFQENLKPMIYSDPRGVKSFNIRVQERVHCLEQLFTHGEYEPTDSDDESTANMAARYEDIESAFPDDLRNNKLQHFLDWFRHNVILIEIVAYSEENAYTIFETMNDRGLSLTSTEMLKGYILANIHDSDSRQRENDNWRAVIQELHRWSKDEDQTFFQAWLRSQYAQTIRTAGVGTKNQDFEKIGTRFHTWVRDNPSKLNLGSNHALPGLTEFLEKDFPFFSDAYLRILNAQKKLTDGLEHVYYISHWGIASSLSYPLMLAPLTVHDDDSEINQKLNTVAHFIENFTVRRSVNYRRFAASSIRYTMYTLVREIRNLPSVKLESVLQNKLKEIGENWNGFDHFGMHGQNKRFVKFLLARITSFIENESGIATSFNTYYDVMFGKPFEIEHIWADSFEDHRTDFEQRDDFDRARNLIGGLLLIPRGTNQSLGAMRYDEKLKHYSKENLLAKSLCEIAYQNNPNFTNMCEHLNIDFRPHNVFHMEDLQLRQQLYRKIAETIWSFDARVQMAVRADATSTVV